MQLFAVHAQDVVCNLVLLAQTRAGDRPGVCADGAASPAAYKLRQGVILEALDRLALPVCGGAEVEYDSFGAQPVHDPRVPGAADAGRYPLHAEVKRFLDAVWLAGLTGVACQPEPGGPSGLERRPVRCCEPGGLIPGQVEPDHAAACKAACVARQRGVLRRRMVAHRA